MEFDGKRVDDNTPYLIDLRGESRFDSYFAEISIDENAINSSIKIEMSTIGDLIGPAIVDTEKLM